MPGQGQTAKEGLQALTPAEEALHRNLVVSMGELRKSLVRTSYFLAQIAERRIHRKMGFGSLAAYAAKHLGLTPDQTEDFRAMGRKLPRYPEVARALDGGTLSWSQARLITKRAAPETHKEWVERARGLSVRDLAEALPSSGTRKGVETDDTVRPKRPDRMSPTMSAPVPRPGRPESTTSASAAESVMPVLFRFSGEQYAIYERLLATMKGDSKEEKILTALAGGSESGSRNHLLVILTCPSCGDAVIPTSRGEVRAEPALLAAAKCSATIESEDGSRRQVVSPRTQRKVLKRARYRCEADGCRHTQFLEIHHRVPLAVGGTSEADNLVVLCSRCHRRLHEAEADTRQALRDSP